MARKCDDRAEHELGAQDYFERQIRKMPWPGHGDVAGMSSLDWPVGRHVSNHPSVKQNRQKMGTETIQNILGTFAHSRLQRQDEQTFANSVQFDAADSDGHNPGSPIQKMHPAKEDVNTFVYLANCGEAG